MTVYYNYISVRDQLFLARKANKCDYQLNTPKKVIGFRVNGATWVASCQDCCTSGFCEVNIFVFTPSYSIPQTVKLYYVKKHPSAFISFLPEVLEILIRDNVLLQSKLIIDKNAPAILPDSML
jgi:hypothetical protein